MTDPVISLSRWRENVPPAHEPGMADARARLQAAMADESRAAEAAATAAQAAARPTRSLRWHRSAGRLQMAGALAVSLAVIAVSANQLSPPAAGNADSVAAASRARQVASLAAMAKLVAHRQTTRTRQHTGATTDSPAGPVLVLPPADQADPADGADQGNVGPTGEPTGPVDDAPADETASPDDESGAGGEDPELGENPLPDGSNAPGDSNPPPADTPPASGKNFVPGQ